MPYTPDNNPYVPGDPYSYDLKWMVQEVKAAQAVGIQAAASAEAAATSANEAAASSLAASASAASANTAAENAAASEENASASAEDAAAIVAPVTQALNAQSQQISVLEGRMNTFASLTEGSTTGDAELQDIRVAADGTVYSTAGDAVRGQVNGLQGEIDEISSSNKNLWLGDADISFTQSYTYTLPTPLPAGQYTFSALVTSNDTDNTYSRIQLKPSNATLDFSRGTREGHYYNATVPITQLIFFASRNTSTSAGDTCEFADFQIESGQSMTAYEPHQLVAYDKIARAELAKIVKYVSASGSDDNSGDSPSSAYLHIYTAISANADIICIAPGTYSDVNWGENQYYRYRHIKIIADNAIYTPPQGLQFRFCNVDISGLTIDLTNATETSAYGFLLLNCTGKLTDCAVIGGTAAGGFRLDGSKLTLIRCKASNCTIDGFNGHTLTTGYETKCTFIDCIANDCGDDGISIHEAGEMYVYGGEFYNNVQTGLAPHDKCTFEAINIHAHHNGKGIEAIKDSLATGETPATGRVIGCILNSNSTYGLDVKNYVVNTLANGYASNGTAPTNAGAGATINTYNLI